MFNSAPIPFDNLAAPEITADVLTGNLRLFVSALALSAEVPEALPLMLSLGVISACVAKDYVISPKEGWNEPINIYSIVALPPANNKSLIMNRCLAPLIEWEKAKCEIAKEDRKRQISERKTQEKLIESKRNALVRIKNRDEQQQAIQEISNLEAELPEIVALPQLFTNNATPESLGHLLSEQNGKFAIFSDEAGILETLSGLYSGGSANIDILLKGIDGGHIRMRRKDDEYNLNPYLTLCLAVQPQTLLNMAQKNAFNGNGALERFLYVVPSSNLGYRTHDKPPVPYDVQQSYHSLIICLLDKSYAQEEQITLTLSVDAKRAWQAFQMQIEAELRPSGKLYSCLGWGGKICGFSLRIAGLLHLASEVKGNEINCEIMLQAIQLANFLTDHALLAYGMMGADEVLTDAKEVWQWILATGKNQLTRTEITHGLRSRKVGKKPRLELALKILCEMNYLATSTMKTKKPTTVYHTNPLASKGGEHV